MGFTDQWFGPQGDIYIIVALLVCGGLWWYVHRSQEVVDGTPYPYTRVKWFRDILAFQEGRYWTVRPDDVGDYNEVVFRLFGDFRPLFDEYIKFVKRIHAFNRVKKIMPELGMEEATGEEETEEPSPIIEDPSESIYVYREGDIDKLINSRSNYLVEALEVADENTRNQILDLYTVFEKTSDQKERQRIEQDIIDFLNAVTERTIVYLPEDEVRALETFAGVQIFWMRYMDTQKIMICLSPHSEAKFIEGSANEKENFISVYSPEQYSMKTTDIYEEEIHIHFCLLRPIGIRDEIFLAEAKSFTRFPSAIIYTWKDMIRYVKHFQTSRINEARANFHSTLFDKFYYETSRGQMRELADEMWGYIQNLRGQVEQLGEKGIEYLPEQPRLEERMARTTQIANWFRRRLGQEEKGVGKTE